ncbi:MAG: VIT and VWA domain-containing protein [Pirellulales bacterium]|nr:VIT and VWA domain-containing protein [Pirellulales bacterium]
MRRSALACPLLLAVAASVIGASGGAWACFMRSTQPVQVWLDHIEVEIDNQVARKTYNCTFKNPNPIAVTGATCFMELEPGAHVEDMRVEVDGKEMVAEILDVDKAKTVFNDMVANGGSPALLEYYGNQLIQTQIPRIAPNGTVNVKLTYTTVLDNRSGLVRLQVLNTNPKASMQKLQSASVKVSVKSETPIKNIYSPTHPIDIDHEPSDCDVRVSWSQTDYLPTHPFVLYYQLAEEKFGAQILTHREKGDDGHFLLMLSPTMGTGTNSVTEDQILPKDIVFCVDRSGSMREGGKMDQAKAALRYCVQNLRPEDRFNIVDFSTGVHAFADTSLSPVNEESVARALRYVDNFAPGGGTAIHDALTQSLDFLSEDGRLKMILFATDGLPNIGESDADKILRSIDQANDQDVRIFVFGEGYDVNTKLLDFLALNHRGEADYILPDEDIAAKISRFYDRVGSPVMTDLEITIDGVGATDVFPRKVPDVFRGEQVLVFGQYRGVGKHKIELSGVIGGERKTFQYELEFPESTDDQHSFVPRLWAGQKVDALIGEVRALGENPPQEMIDDITYLAMRYGIVTPYTSFLMADDLVANNGQPGVRPPMARGAFRRDVALKLATADADAAGGLAGGGGRSRVATAKNAADDKRFMEQSGGASSFYGRAEREMRKYGQQGSALEAVRYVGSLTFYRAQNRWFDSRYEPADVKDVESVEVRSRKFFDLLEQHGSIAKYLSLGNVTLKVNGRWYKFVDSAQE